MVHRVKQVSIVVLSMLVLLSTLIVGTYAKATNLVSMVILVKELIIGV